MILIVNFMNNNNLESIKLNRGDLNIMNKQSFLMEYIIWYHINGITD